MIDGVEVVIETGDGDLFGRQAAAVLKAPVDQEDAQAGFGEIAAENEAVMAGADNDAVVGLFQRLAHAVLPLSTFHFVVMRPLIRAQAGIRHSW